MIKWRIPRPMCRPSIFLLALALILAATIASLSYLQLAQTPSASTTISPASQSELWRFTREDGEELSIGQDGAISIGEGETIYLTYTLPESLSQSALLEVSAYGCDVAFFLDGSLLADPSLRFDQKGFSSAPGQGSSTGLFSLNNAAGKQLKLAVQFLGVPANINVLPVLILYGEIYDYNTQALSAAAEAALPAGMFLAAGLFLFGLFLVKLWKDRTDWGLLLLAVAFLAFCLNRSVTYGLYSVVILQSPAVTWLVQVLPVLPLLWLLWFDTSGWRKRLLWILPLGCTAACAFYAVTGLLGTLHISAMNILQGKLLPLAMVFSLAIGIWEAIRTKGWYRSFFALGGCALGIVAVWAGVDSLIHGRLWPPCSEVWTAVTGWGSFFQLLNFFCYLLLLVSFLLAVYGFVRELAQRDAQLQTLMIRERSIAEQLALLQENSACLRELRHDVQHHNATLLGLCQAGDSQRAVAYLRELIAKEDALPATVYTVHPVVNTILSAMLTRAQRLGIKTSAQVSLTKDIPVTDTDISSLLMNLLENAIEANEKAAPEEQKWIHIDMHIKGHYLYIEVKNARFEAVDYQEKSGLCRTTKKESGHGFGLRIVRKVVYKYQGELRLQTPDKEFCVCAALLLHKD